MPTIDLALAMDVFGHAQEIPHPPPRHCRELVPLADDLIIGPLPEHKDVVIDACGPRGVNYKPHLAFGSQYGVARLNAIGQGNQFDADSRLRKCVQLSRIIQPTALDFRFAGRLTTGEGGEITEFAPARLVGGADSAFVADQTHNWLSDANVEELRELVALFDPATLPERILRALFYHEYVHQLYYVDARWPMATTGLESLIHTDRQGSANQFVQRGLGLQTALGIAVASEEDLTTIYHLRSALTHGQSLGGLGADERRLYQALESLLRRAIHEAIVNPNFARLFIDAASVRAQWPL